MKKLLFVGMMCLMNLTTFAEKNSSNLKECTVHYTVVNEDGGVIWGPADVTADTCEHALGLARTFYHIATGDSSVFPQ
ncbi:hypothetical protein [Pedobacter soli]|uniref:Uncharacterized protein n=1 Tax=Pedobacter soli TaxID=390242 RepID=A0A1G6ZY09_9SPHI|nr:hypothetical protein [Pedobacter soli]SDE07263.1 hypothetical protein SAMN04488024_11175 [Pedobacter soli]